MGKFSPNLVANYLAALAAHDPDGLLVACGERRITCRQVAGRVFRLSRALLGLGVRPGDKVAFMFHNVPEFIETNYAIQVAGAVPVPINYRFTAREIEYQAGHSDSSVFLYHERFAPAVEEAAPKLPGIRAFIRSGAGALAAAKPYEEFLQAGEPSDPAVPTALSDVAVMIYTGGTTGFPKGVMLTYGAHLDMFASMLAGLICRGAAQLRPAQLDQVAEVMPLPGVRHLLGLLGRPFARKLLARPGTVRQVRSLVRQVLLRPGLARFGYKNRIRYMTPSMPFFHDASYQILMLGLFAGNLTYILTEELKFEPAAILEIIARDKPAFIANVPTGWKKLVAEPRLSQFDVSSVKVGATGAGVCPVALKKKMFEAFPGMIILDMFGQTEMTPITSFRIDADPSTLKERSVGRSIFPVRIVDELGQNLPAGQIGEIYYHSRTVMKGYYKDEAKTAEVMEDGWFRSGDLGYLDEDGEVRLVDRKQECINTGGEKVFPLEVEEVLHLHPAVEEVAVIGVPDEEWGHNIRAVVQLKPGVQTAPDELIGFCRDQLAGYKIPRSVVFVDELPLSAAGKVLRAKIREAYGK